ncbi:hypothetical protein ACIGKL_13985 [Pseudomonas sp. NPDC077186]|uniref:hypothetical protein n=1 Tax=Pseudomonas sp. NPDC077186 TaxID=3364421 RepID=UPI0037CBE7C5
MNTRIKKHPLQRRAGQALLFILFCGYLAGCAALELEPITYQEAVTQYQEGGGIENYRCALVPADEHYGALPGAQPIAVEIDEVLFVKIAGTVQELQQTEITETGAAYAHADMSATLTTVGQFNHSEYNESDDRHVDLTFDSGGKTETYKTFGAACGL